MGLGEFFSIFFTHLCLIPVHHRSTFAAQRSEVDKFCFKFILNYSEFGIFSLPLLL